jgi:hypothetical protein
MVSKPRASTRPHGTSVLGPGNHAQHERVMPDRRARSDTSALVRRKHQSFYVDATLRGQECLEQRCAVSKKLVTGCVALIGSRLAAQFPLEVSARTSTQTASPKSSVRSSSMMARDPCCCQRRRRSSGCSSRVCRCVRSPVPPESAGTRSTSSLTTWAMPAPSTRTQYSPTWTCSGSRPTRFGRFATRSRRTSRRSSSALPATGTCGRGWQSTPTRSWSRRGSLVSAPPRTAGCSSPT